MSDPIPDENENLAGVERSKSGTPIYRYEVPKEKPEIVGGDPSLIKAVDAHIERHLGQLKWVFHEIVSTTIHVDIHICPPTEERPFFTLVTSGMAERPMRPPAQASACEFAELCICLPPDWPGLADPNLKNMNTRDPSHPWKDERNYWPIRALKWLARFPHEYKTWLWLGHTAHNGNPPVPFAASTKMCAALLDINPLLPQAFHKLRVGDRDILFMTIIPLYEEEVKYKLDHGYKAFTDLLDSAGVSPIVDPGRACVVGRKGGAVPQNAMIKNANSASAKKKPWWKFW